MPVITVRLWAGRTRAQKAELARRITDAMVEVAGCERATVRVIFDDYAKSDWAVGGRLADEADSLELGGRREEGQPSTGGRRRGGATLEPGGRPARRSDARAKG